MPSCRDLFPVVRDLANSSPLLSFAGHPPVTLRCCVTWLREAARPTGGAFSFRGSQEEEIKRKRRGSWVHAGCAPSMLRPPLFASCFCTYMFIVCFMLLHLHVHCLLHAFAPTCFLPSSIVCFMLLHLHVSCRLPPSLYATDIQKNINETYPDREVLDGVPRNRQARAGDCEREHE